jgi:hypothetical protein
MRSVRHITVISDNGPAIDAEPNGPAWLVVDREENLYIADLPLTMGCGR